MDKTYTLMPPINPLILKIPDGAVGLTLNFKADRITAINVLVYSDSTTLYGQMNQFATEAALWFGPERSTTSPHNKPLAGQKTLILVTPPMADIDEPATLTLDIKYYYDLAAYRHEFAAVLNETPYTSKAFDTRQMTHPHAEERRWYAGDFHTHSFFSDGNQTPEENRRTAERYGLDFVHMTEHTVFVEHGPESPDVLFLPGVELTVPKGHFNVHFAEKSPYDGYPASSNVKGKNIRKLLAHASEDGYVALNHPFMEPWQMRFNKAPMDVFTALEIMTDPTYPTSAKNTAKALRAWSVLWNHGLDLIGIGGSDAHLSIGETYPGTTELSRIGDPATWILANRLSPEALKEGYLKKRVTFSRKGRIDMRFTQNYMNGKCRHQTAVGAHCSLPTIELEAIFDGREELFPIWQWVADGKIIAEDQGRTSRQMFETKDFHWIRVDLRTEDGRYLGSTNPLRVQNVEVKPLLWGELKDLLAPATKAVVFDKDGTLMHFSEVWVNATEQYFQYLSLKENELIAARQNVGILAGSVLEDSPLAAGTLEQIVAAINDAMKRPKADVDTLRFFYASYLHEHPEACAPRGNIKGALEALKERGIKVGILTSDHHDLARLAFKLMGVDHLIDTIIGGDEPFAAKPSPCGVMEIARRFGLDLSELMFVGDSVRDMLVGHYTGKVIAFPGSVSDAERLEALADGVIEEIGEVLEHLN